VEALEQKVHIHGAQALLCADPERTGELARGANDRIPRGGRLREDLACVRQEREGCGCRLDRARRALEELRVEFLLQAPDPGRQPGLRDPASLGGPCEVPLLGEGDQVFELALLHGASGSDAGPASIRLHSQSQNIQLLDFFVVAT